MMSSNENGEVLLPTTTAVKKKKKPNRNLAKVSLYSCRADGRNALSESNWSTTTRSISWLDVGFSAYSDTPMWQLRQTVNKQSKRPKRTQWI
jgi:hypothetical protein